MKPAILSLIVLLTGACGCASPEATRQRGGRGADTGNRDRILNLHEGANQFAKTPTLIPAKPPPLDSANQAARLARQ
jgi:hypothetical protein